MTSAISSLLYSNYSRPTRLADLIAERPRDVTLAVFGSVAGTETSQSRWQTSPMQNLKNYVTDNLKGHDARKLMAQIAALEGLYAMQDPEYANQAAYSMLAGNRNALQQLPTGSLMNRLF